MFHCRIVVDFAQISIRKAGISKGLFWYGEMEVLPLPS